ncbi:NACHT, LRR and PYD domains-containing protein 3-like [Megalobrama amblycephala]|uniref:NACHT, LRR and PYD domains-containing protein 3-like n=1 Tax=Megalobrama amblycephala TaxID=75352 RepID=UPI00201464C2|nr:NACHT, LRR and PYD domains-containing protein 3-like [Megalobrama amblycephala]
MTISASLNRHNQRLNEELQKVKNQHKSSMKNKFERLLEGMKLQENETLLLQCSQDTPIDFNDIFKALPEPGCEEKDQIKTVLTKGIAGIGKTVSVQKFILDWAEGKANQDVDFMFVLPFRELNLIRDHQYSLHRLLLDFHPELQDLDSKIYEECKVVFIFDGLDESRMALMFSDAQKVSDVTETSSVGVLMSNLIKGELLPSALIWITSRPVAANQIPSKYINRLTEIQGFNELQKEEYIRKRISNEHQACRIILHIRRARSLHIMCHIPIFCWISSTVLQKLLKEDLSAEIPQTLTEMYIHFLLIQINMRNQKYEEKKSKELLKSNRKVIVKLAEVAFKQLMNGNVMFYEEDLRESGIDVTDASVYSGICTEIFKEESVIHQRKVYSFIHLSFQEFLAAFYVFYCYLSKNKEPLQLFLYKFRLYRYENVSLYDLLASAVDKALESENGQLDLFLRFLLGISLESNQRLLQDLLTHRENSSESVRETTHYIKEKIKDGHGLYTERSIKLFLCLLEVKDQTMSREIQEFVKSDKHSEEKLSPVHCSTIAYMLQISKEPLDELDLKKYNTSDEGRRRLIPAVINCRKSLLAGCNLTGQDCESLSSALQSQNCVLRELDLSNNDLQDSGVKLLSEGLNSPNSQLQILKLSGCMVTEEGCCYVSSALSSNPSHLRELDFSYNHPGDSGVKLLSDKLKDPNCSLQILNVDHCGEFRITAGLHKYACDLTLDPNTANTRLILSDENRKITYVEDHQSYPDHPERFDDVPQVLCGESLTGRCYWEAEWSKDTEISVTYKGISRKGLSDCWFGFNDKSWSLNCSNISFSVRHNKNSTDIPVLRSSSNRVGVYVDVSAGTLSFYSVSDTHTLTHLHTFNTTFTEPLYAGFRVYPDSSVSLCDIKQPPVRNNSDTHTTGVDHCGEFRSTAELHKYACDLTLDPNTANTHIILSEENKKITCVEDLQPYPDHPERFNDVPQVLCEESLTGRCYWEAEWSGYRAEISVTYKGIGRKAGRDCWFGFTDKSWSLNCTDNRFSVCHNKSITYIPAISSCSNRVGVYVDVSAGSLSFYSVSDTHTLTHLHTFNTTFTEPLYAGFGLYPDSSVRLCDIKQPPVRNNSDTHTTGFSDSKPSGLNIHPLLNCQSCVHIADSDQWVQIEPSACTDGGSKFRVSTDPGHYECVRTRMRWVCDCDVTLQYCTVDGHFLNKELERLQCNRIGPVIDVTVISGKLEEVHLPHYACLGESDPSLKDAVKVLSVKDEGITTEPVQLTRFHAKIVQPSFSLKTLIISWIMRVDEHCDLLLYMCSKVPVILHVYFFPFDDCVKEKVERDEKSSYPIKHPRPDRPLRMKTPHKLSVPGASIHPNEGITFRRETPPNYFKVTTRLENDLYLSLTRTGNEEDFVWTAIIERDELNQILRRMSRVE